MSILPGYIINAIMLFVSHPVADKYKPLLWLSELGVIIHANNKNDWARNVGNAVIEEGSENYAYERDWKHKYNVKLIYYPKY